jgi:hypothetical protein
MAPEGPKRIPRLSTAFTLLAALGAAVACTETSDETLLQTLNTVSTECDDILNQPHTMEGAVGARDYSWTAASQDGRRCHCERKENNDVDCSTWTPQEWMDPNEYLKTSVAKQYAQVSTKGPLQSTAKTQDAEGVYSNITTGIDGKNGQCISLNTRVSIGNGSTGACKRIADKIRTTAYRLYGKKQRTTENEVPNF